jgi:hypothetical protein
MSHSKGSLQGFKPHNGLGDCIKVALMIATPVKGTRKVSFNYLICLSEFKINKPKVRG